MRPTGTSNTCGGGGKYAARPMCWPPAATTHSSPPPVMSAGPMSWSPAWTHGPGGGFRPVPAHTAPASTTGRASPSASAGPEAGGTGCWPAARSARPTRSPTSSATAPAAPPWPISPGSPEHAGASRNASSKPRTKPAWTTTRSAPGGPGTPASPCRCSPTPGWRWRGLERQRGNRSQRDRHDQLHATGNPPLVDQLDPPGHPPRRTNLVQVELAKTPPTPSSPQPLQTSRLPTQPSAVAVLGNQIILNHLNNHKVVAPG